MNKGLSHNSVLSVAQDNDGFVWIGTRDGLIRFDGIEFYHFNKEFGDSTSLSNNHINSIHKSKNGDLWFGTADGLNRMKKGENRFHRLLMDEDLYGNTSNYIRTVTEIHSGLILAGTSYGINIYDPATNISEHVEIPHTNTRSGSVICIMEDSDMNIWIGSRNGLYSWDLSTFTHFILDEKVQGTGEEFEIRDIIEDRWGNFWVATEHYGLYRFRLENGIPLVVDHFHKGNSEILSDQIRTIRLIDDNHLWLGTVEGLSIFDISESVFYNTNIDPGTSYGLSNYSIRDIFRDAQGGIWLGTYAGGLFYYHNQNNLFKQFKLLSNHTSKLGTNVIAGFLEDDSENIWIATDRGGLIYYSSSTGQSTIYRSQGDEYSLANNNVKSMVADKNGNLWIGTVNGLSYFDRKVNTFKTYRHQHDEPNSLANNQVHALFIDDRGILWIGTNGGGLQMLDVARESFTQITTVSERNINVLLASGDGRLWVGGQSGLECINIETGIAVESVAYLEDNPALIQYVQCLFEDKDGIIWFGTMGYGLFAISDNDVYWFSNENGLPDNTVNSILQDESGKYWITSNSGLSRVEFLKDQGRIELIYSKTYSVNHGLQGKQFYPMSSMISLSGEFYFGGNNGINVFIPAEIDDFDFYPNVVLTSFSIRSPLRSDGSVEDFEDTNVNSISEIVLPFRQRNVSISFSGINYINPNQTFYRYMLKNHDIDWVDIGNQRTLNFNYLPVGEYELRLKASTSSDNWGDDFKSLELSVLPPWWTTRWAFVIYFFGLSFFLLIFFHFSQKWASLKNELAMEHFQREREKDLHQSKMRFFTDVSHELRTPLTLILAPIERIIDQPDLTNRLRNQLMLIQRNGHRMMQLINKVLDLRRLETGHGKLYAVKSDLVKFLDETSLAFQETTRLKSIDFSFKSELITLPFYFDREKLEIILYNLLSNSLKNTPSGGKIGLGLDLTDSSAITAPSNPSFITEKYAILKVTDNGRGIPPDLIDKIFNRFYSSDIIAGKSSINSGVGLELTKRMVELHRGIISVECKYGASENERFTQFTVFLPIGSDHLAEDEIQDRSGITDAKSEYINHFELPDIDERAFTPEHKSFSDLPPTGEIKEKSQILIIEDNQEVRQFIASIFEDEFMVLETEDGDLGLEKAFSKIPDLIICDVMMPVINGMEFCRQVKTDIRTSHVPVILLTAQTAITFKYEGLETGADDYITKPFSPNYLLVKVKNLIRQRDLMRKHFQHEAICNPGKITVTSLDEKLLKNAVDYINSNISDSSLNVEKLSREIGLSRVHFYRKIKALTNLTAVEFIRSVRLKRAAWLIQQNKLHIKEVRHMVGFEDAEYFRDCFTKQFKKTPSEYARQHQKGL